MSGVQLQVTIDDTEVRAALAGAEERATDMTPAFDEIGATVVSHTLLRFASQTDPDGHPWTPLSPVTVALRGGGNPHILVNHGILRGSITHIAHSNEVEIGTNVVYGAIQQLGGDTGRGHRVHIPARPYLGIDQADREDIPDILGRFLVGGNA